MSQKFNEDIIRQIIENDTIEAAIQKIAEAITARDEIIKDLQKEVDYHSEIGGHI